MCTTLLRPSSAAAAAAAVKTNCCFPPFISPRYLGPPPPPPFQDAGENRAEVKQTYADITLAREVLGFVPKTSIEEGLRRFADWYHSDARKASFSEVIMDRPISEGPK